MVLTTDTRICVRCEIAPVDDRSYCRACINEMARTSRAKRDNRGRTCSECKKNKVTSKTGYRCAACVTSRSNKARTNDPDLNRRRHLKWKYNLSLEQYEEMLSAQNGVCAICKNPPVHNPLAVDHDHKCCPGAKSCGNCIRALLCVYCNSTVGKLESESFAPHLAYIKEHG